MSITKHYRVAGRDEYTIEYRQQPDGTYKIFARACPSDPHGNGSSVHHRYASGEICVASGREPRTLDRAKAVALVWMDSYSQYVQTGSFPSGKRRVNV